MAGLVYRGANPDVGAIETAGGLAVLTLRIVSQNKTTVTVGWTPVSCLGYALYRGISQKPVSNSWDPTKNTWTISRVGGTIRVVALAVGAAGTITP